MRPDLGIKVKDRLKYELEDLRIKDQYIEKIVNAVYSNIVFSNMLKKVTLEIRYIPAQKRLLVDVIAEDLIRVMHEFKNIEREAIFKIVTVHLEETTKQNV